jgi:hypothetical protein
MSNFNFNITLPNVSYDTESVIKITGKRNIDDNDISFDITTTTYVKRAKLDNPNSAAIYNDKGEIKYANGDIYNGDIKYGKRHGKGEMKYANGGIYNGDWKDNKRDGKGEMKFHSGDIYNGDWKDDKIDGKGVAKYANGDIYNGDWKDYKRDGKGEYKYHDGDIYNGDWKNEKKMAIIAMARVAKAK